MNIKIISKLATIKLIIFLLFLPLITHTMQHNKIDISNATIRRTLPGLSEPLFEDDSVTTMPLSIDLKPQDSHNTAVQTNSKKRKRNDESSSSNIPKELGNILYTIQKGLERSDLICTYKNCQHTQVYANITGLRNHIIANHAKQFKCKRSQCNKFFRSITEQHVSQCHGNRPHKIISCDWTPEREQELLTGFNLTIEEVNNQVRNKPNQKPNHNSEDPLFHQLIYPKPAPEDINPDIEKQLPQKLNQNIISDDFILNGINELIEKIDPNNPELGLQELLNDSNRTTEDIPLQQIGNQLVQKPNQSIGSDLKCNNTLSSRIAVCTSNPDFNNLLNMIIDMCKTTYGHYNCYLHAPTQALTTLKDFKEHLFTAHLQADKCTKCALQNPTGYCVEHNYHIFPSSQDLYKQLDSLYLMLFQSLQPDVLAAMKALK